MPGGVVYWSFGKFLWARGKHFEGVYCILEGTLANMTDVFVKCVGGSACGGLLSVMCRSWRSGYGNGYNIISANVACLGSSMCGLVYVWLVCGLFLGIWGCSWS